MSGGYFIDDRGNVWVDGGTWKAVFGQSQKTEIQRIDDSTVEDVSYTFDLSLGEYVETGRTQRGDPLYTLDEIKSRKLAEIQSARDSAIYTSVTSSALGTPKTYNYSRDAAENFRDEALDLLVDTSITYVDWYVIEDAAFVTHTRDQFNQVLKDVSAHETPLKMRYFTLEAQVNAATTVDAVNAIVW